MRFFSQTDVGSNYPKKVQNTKINIKYWTNPEGEDFKGISVLFNTNYLLKINKKRTDTCGGGLYDIVIKITEDISFIELAKSYLEDGLKVLIGLAIKPVFVSLKKLFKTNKVLNPSIQELVLDFSDCKIKIYNHLQNDIEDIFDDLVIELFNLRLKNKKFFKRVKTIHIPIVKRPDYYKLCNNRVIFTIDEPIRKITKEFYFGYWGLSTSKGKHIYDVKVKTISKEKFYTYKSYEKLFNKASKSGKLD